MPYKVQLPNNTIVEIDDNVPPEQARLMIAREFPDLFKRKQGFKPAMSSAFDSGIGAIQSFGADLAEKAGMERVTKGLRKSAEKNYKEAEQSFDPTTSEDVDAAFEKQGIMSGIGALARKYGTEQVGGMVGTLAPSALGAAAGAVLPVPGAAEVGFAAPFFAQSAGENMRRQRQANPEQDPDMLAATGTALLQTAIGRFGFGKMLHGAAGSQIAMREASKIAPKVLTGEISRDAAVNMLGGRLRNVLAETGASFAINAGSGIADEGLRRLQAGQPVTDDEALQHYKDMAIGAGVLAPAFGAFHGAGARGRAVGKLDTVAKQGETERAAIQAEQQAGVRQALEADRLAAEQEAAAAAPRVLTPDEVTTGNRDAAYRAVEMRDAADPARRADAEAAFSQAALQPDMFGLDKLVDPAAPRTARTRTEDTPPPLELSGQEQAELPLVQTGSRATDVRPELTLGEPPPVSPQGELPLTQSVPGPEFKLEAQPAAQTELPFPKVSSRDDFKGLVYETSPTWKNGKLDGHVLDTVAGLNNLQKVLKTYTKNLEDSEKNAERRAGLEQRIEQLETMKAQLKPVEKEHAASATLRPDAADVRLPIPDEVKPNETTTTLPDPVTEQRVADDGASVADLEVRRGPDAVSKGLPETDGGADAVPDRVAESGVRGKESGDVALKNRSQAALGAAVEAGDFGGVTTALAASKNPMIQHLGQQAAKLQGVTVGPGEQSMYVPRQAAATIDAMNTRSEHEVGHEVAHAMTQHAIDHPTPQQKPIVERITRLYEHVKKVLKGKDYGLTDVHEFVAEAYTNAAFQKKLAKIPYQNTTVWGKFTELVAKLLGLKNDNAFTEFLANAEQLEATGLKAEKSSAPVKYLGNYADSTTPEMPRGAFGRAVDVARGAKQKGAKATLSDWWDRIQFQAFDVQHGATRFLDRAWTRATDHGVEATARALLQHSNYAPQMARESLAVGTLTKNKEGTWMVEASDANMRSFIDAVSALPTEENKFRIANGIMTNLSYAEREAMLGAKKASAIQLQNQARIDIKAANQMTGAAAAAAHRKARAQLAMAQELLDQDYKRPAGVTDATIAQAVKDANTPEVKRMLDIVREINMQNIKIAEEGGIISKETGDLWRQNKYYVPLTRVFEEAEAMQDLHFPKGAPEIKKFKGSARDVDDIMENMIRQRMFMAAAAMRNNANVKAAHELLAVPGNPAGVTRYDQRPQGVKNLIAMKEEGEKVYYKVDDPMAFTTLRGLVDDAPQLINALEHVTRFFRESIMLSPDATIRNLIRDTAEVWAYSNTSKGLIGTSGDIIGQFGKSLPGVIRQGFSDRNHLPHYAVQKFGITGAKEFTSLDAEKTAIIREQMKKAGVKDFAGATDAFIGGLERILKPLQNAATEGELAPRQHVFSERLKATGSETEAIMAAINTLDFRRRGASQSITLAKKLIPFFNSSMQGMYKLIRTVGHGDNLGGMNQDAVRRAFVVQGLKMMAAATAYQAYMQDDEEYMRVPKQTRDHNILIPLGDGVFGKVPLPFEFGSMFWTVPANVLDYMAGQQNGQEFIDAMQSTVLHTLPGAIPQAVKPALENATNYSFFTGKPLESAAMQRLDPAHRAYDTTSDVAKGIGETAGVSPIKVDNLLKGYFGSLGQFLVQTFDTVFGESQPDRPWNKMPIVRSAVTDPLQSAHKDRFYQLRDTVEKVHATAMNMAKAGKTQDALAYLNGETGGVKNKTLYDMYTGVNRLSREIQKANARIREIKASDETPEMKRAQVEHIQRLINATIEKEMPALRQATGQSEEEDDEE